MELTPYIAALQRQLETAAAAGGDDAAALAERLVAPLEASTRLVLLDALSAAAGEISAELAPGSVDLRLRAGEPEFVVDVPAAEPPAADPAAVPWTARSGAGDESAATARINLRLPEELKALVDSAAGAAGLSVNTWLVRAIAASVDGGTRGGGGGDRIRLQHPDQQSYRGWVS